MNRDRANMMLNGRRPLLIIAMLSMSLVLIGVLGWQSWRLQQSNAAVADSVLREYAILVADEYGRRATAALGYQGYYALISRIAGASTPVAMRSAVAADESLREAITLAASFFSISGDDVLVEAGDMSPDRAAQLSRIAADPGRRDAPYYSYQDPTGSEQIIYAVRPSAGQRVAITGFIVRSEGVNQYLRAAFERGPLLPQSLAGGRVSNDMLFLRVTNPGGHPLFEINPQFDSRLAATKVLGDDYQAILKDFEVTVSLDPSTASSLVIGGLPASRMPLLLVVMGLVIALMLAALWLFRREQAVMNLRADFVSQVSHELRTPLTQIRMFAETLLLDRARSDDERRRSLRIIDRESQRLSHLVDNILRFSSNRDALQLDCRPQALAPIIREVCDVSQATIGTATLQLSLDESARADIDADALRQILLNLVDNAVKYGPPQQEITVTVSSDEKSVRLSVEDQGPGIPESERDRVWAAFYRLRREQGTAISGTGIGLSIVRELAEAMRGECRIETPNGGARVTVVFPLWSGHD